MADKEDKTQAPTERRRLKAREEGQVALSREVVVAAGLAAGVAVMTWGAPSAGNALLSAMRQDLGAWGASPRQSVEVAAGNYFWAVLPFLCAGLAAVSLATLLQTGFLLNMQALTPDPARIGVRRGLKRLLGIDHLVDVGKALGKLCVLVWAARTALFDAWPTMTGSLIRLPEQVAAQTWHDLMHLMLLVLAAQSGIALLDIAWTRHRFERTLRMSREDLRQESKESEGDPQIKARIRQLRQARARRRMLAAVSKATVVITNPTHYAVALSYQRGGSAAPRVVAKGVDEVAARIREAAAKARVPLVTNPPLARALHALEFDAEVPPEHFAVVAEIIAYVWRLKRPASPPS